MANNVTGNVGNNDVELNNAATEQTLKDLLKSVMLLNSSVLKIPIAQQAAALNADRANDQLDQFADIVSQTSRGTSQLAQSSSLLSKTFNLLESTVGSLAFATGFLFGTFEKLSTGVLSGQGKLSNLFDAFKNWPFLIGDIAGVIGKLVKFQEENMSTYREVTKVGVDFAGSLVDLRMAALSSYMSLTEFSSLVTSNGRTLSMLGKNTNEGAIAFSKISNTLIKSNIGQQLLSMGYGFDELNQMTMKYVEMTGGRTASELENIEAITSASAEYLTQLTALSNLTGQSRDALKTQMEEQAANAAFEAALQNMDEEQKKRAMEGLAQSLAYGGKGAAEAFKSQILGMPPMTEAARMFVALAPTASRAINTVVASVTDSSISMDKAVADMVAGISSDSKRLGIATNSAFSMMTGPVADQARVMQKLDNQLRQQGIVATDDQLRRMVEENNRKRALANSEAATMAEGERALKELGITIMFGLTPVIKALMPAVQTVVRTFSDFIKTVDLAYFGKSLASGLTSILEYSKNLFSEAGWEKILNDIRTGFETLFIDLRERLNLISSEQAKIEREQLEQRKKDIDLIAQYSVLESELKPAIGAIEEALKIEQEGKQGYSSRKMEELQNQEKINQLKTLSEEQKKLPKEKQDEIIKARQSEIDHLTARNKILASVLAIIDTTTYKIITTDDRINKSFADYKRLKELEPEVTQAKERKEKQPLSLEKQDEINREKLTTEESIRNAITVVIEKSIKAFGSFFKTVTGDETILKFGEEATKSRIQYLTELTKDRTIPPKKPSETPIPEKKEETSQPKTPIPEKKEETSQLETPIELLPLLKDDRKRISRGMKSLNGFEGFKSSFRSDMIDNKDVISLFDAGNNSTNIVNKIDEIKNMSSVKPDFTELKDAIKEAVTPPKDTKVDTRIPVETADNNRIMTNLIEEVKQLNAQTTALLSMNKEAVEYAKKHLDATKSLNRNLYPT